MITNYTEEKILSGLDFWTGHLEYYLSGHDTDGWIDEENVAVCEQKIAELNAALLQLAE